MSAKVPLSERRAAVLATAEKIDEVSSSAMDLFKSAGSMAAEIQVAQAMADLRAMLTPEVMAPIMALADTDLGFRTDRDPKQTNKNGQANTPYSIEVVRDAVIEAKLRGFHVVGNEFNIIANRFYAAKNGFRRKLTDGKSFPGLSDFRDAYDLPVIGNNNATVKCRATWLRNGKQDSVECTFLIRVNAFMGADAVIGKAERKLCKRVHDLLSGINTPDGEASDVDVEIPAQTPPQAPRFAQRQVTNDDPSPEAPATTEPAKLEPQAAVESAAPTTHDAPPDALTGPQQKLLAILQSEGATFDDMLKVCREISAWKYIVEGVTELSQIKDAGCEQLVGRDKSFRQFLRSAIEQRGGAQ